MQPKISIIIPIYNCQNSLEKCLNSALAQTYRDFEIIAVDDGSTDDSGKICDRFAKLDDRIIVHHKNNGGVSSARNTGIALAKADYITFLDADDWMEKDCLKHLMLHQEINPPISEQSAENIEQSQNNLSDLTQIDMVITGHVKLTREGRIEKRTLSQEIYSVDRIRNEYPWLSSIGKPHAPWGNRYDKRILQDLRFDEGMRIREDLLFNLQYLERCKKVLFLPYLDYVYDFTNISSAAHFSKISDFEQFGKVYLATAKFLKGYPSVTFANTVYINNVLYLINNVCKSKLKNKKSLIKGWLNDPTFNQALNVGASPVGWLKKAYRLAKSGRVSRLIAYNKLVTLAVRIRRGKKATLSTLILEESTND